MRVSAKHLDELRAIRSQRDAYQVRAAQFMDERDKLREQVVLLRTALKNLVNEQYRVKVVLGQDAYTKVCCAAQIALENTGGYP